LSGDWTRVAVPEVLAFAFKQNEYDSVSTRPDREAALRSFLILRAAQAVPRFPAEFAKLLDPLKARIGEEGVSPKPPIDPFAAGSGAAWLLEPPAVK
jgi:hypothetical protein